MFLLKYFNNARRVIYDPINALKSEPKAVKEFLLKYGDIPIVSIEICRTPISGFFKSILDVLTNGDFTASSRALNYDDIFHLYMIVHLKTGLKILVERNQRVNITTIIQADKGDTQCQYVDLHGRNDLTLNKLIYNTVLQVGVDIYHYDAVYNNCQKFITQILTANNLFNNNLDNFINQRSEDFLKSDTIRWLGNSLTDIASIGTNLLHGGQMKK